MPVTTGLQTVGFGANTKISYLVQTAAGAIDSNPEWTVVPFASGEMTVQALAAKVAAKTATDEERKRLCEMQS